MNNRLIRALALASLTLLASACQTTSATKPLPKELLQSAVVSTNSPGFNPQPGTHIQWHGNIMVHAPENTPADPESLLFIREQIESQLQAKGYRVTAAGQPADYALKGLIVLGSDLSEKELRDILGFDPGLVASGTTYQTGSLLLMLLNASTGEAEWRSAVEILAAPDLPDDIRQQRLRYGIASLLRPLPTVGPAP